jgi:hypothetical protein
MVAVAAFASGDSNGETATTTYIFTERKSMLDAYKIYLELYILTHDNPYIIELIRSLSKYAIKIKLTINNPKCKRRQNIACRDYSSWFTSILELENQQRSCLLFGPSDEST